MADGKIILPVPIKHTDNAAIGDREKHPAYTVRHADFLSSAHSVPPPRKEMTLFPLMLFCSSLMSVISATVIPCMERMSSIVIAAMAFSSVKPASKTLFKALTALGLTGISQSSYRSWSLCFGAFCTDDGSCGFGS